MADYGEIIHKITPTQWVLIAGGGLGLGILLRMRKKAQTPAATSQGFDTSQYSGTGQTGYVQGNAFTPQYDPNQVSNAPTTPVPVTTPPTPPSAPYIPPMTPDMIALSQQVNTVMAQGGHAEGLWNPGASPTPSMFNHTLAGISIPSNPLAGSGQHIQPGGNTGTLPTRSNIGI